MVFRKSYTKEHWNRNTRYGIGFARELEMRIFYKAKLIGTRRVDFLIENVISVELKAIVKLEDVHLAQAINYLEAYNLKNNQNIKT